MGSNFKHRALIAMSLFKLDAEKNLQKTLDAAKSIATRLITAKTLLAEHHTTAKQSARNNADDATLDKAKNKIRAAQIRIDTLSATLIETDQQILQLENDLTVAADKKQREATALEVEKIAEGLTSAAVDVVTSLAALALQTESMARFLPDAAGLHSFAVRANAELPGSIEMLTMLTRAYTDAVLAGRANATLPQVEAAAPPPAPPPPTQWAFSVKPIKWTDASGTVQTQHAFFEVQLPPVVAARALRKGACVGMDHELRKREHGFGSNKAKPDPADCIDLDEGTGGQALAKTGGSGTTTPCETCHGADLKGVDAVPGIAGRSPSYLVRQMGDFQQHPQEGSAGALMVPVVEKLSRDHMISLD
jgi:cytochrome c553